MSSKFMVEADGRVRSAVDASPVAEEESHG
jgi:hypothetical protein